MNMEEIKRLQEIVYRQWCTPCEDEMGCTYKMRRWEFTPSDSPQYHIRFNLELEFKFTKTRHPTVQARVAACAAVPLGLPLDQTRRVFSEGARAAIRRAVCRADLPHLSDGDMRYLAGISWDKAWRIIREEPICGHKDLNIDLLMTVKNPIALVYGPSRGAFPASTGAFPASCYACAFEKCEIESGNYKDICCCICLGDFVSIGQGGSSEEEAWCLPCKHVFHGDCIQKWLRTSHNCPLCWRRLR